MRQAIRNAGLVAVCLCAALLGGLAHAQESTVTTIVSQATLEDVARKLDDLATRQPPRDTGEVAAQLAQILKNQEAMMAELYVIKIRVSRR